jgi:sec-independent protein translocase protein TatA
MFDIGWPELLLICVAALILFGPQRLPDVARSLGRSIKAFKEGLKEGLEEPETTEKKQIASAPSEK